jgi:dCMP deaminase
MEIPRPNWNQYFSELIKITATRSSCKKLQVGCMLVKDNRIISQGYNGHLAGCQHYSYSVDNHEVATVHAEQNAIIDCAKRGVSCNNCTAYITHFPCLTCAKLLLSSGIKEIIYLKDYNNDPLVYWFCCQKKCSILQLQQIRDSNNKFVWQERWILGGENKFPDNIEVPPYGSDELHKWGLKWINQQGKWKILDSLENYTP